MLIGHKIELEVNLIQKEHLSKACGISRFVYNWILENYKNQLEKYKETKEKSDKPDILKLKKEFNKIKRKEYPFILEVTKCASEQPFANFQKAMNNFFRDKKRFSFPKKKVRNDNRDRFYISNDKFKVEGNYVFLPKIGKIKMKEGLKFKGKIMSGVVSKAGNKYYISITVDISSNKEQIEEFYKNKKINNPKLKDEIKVRNFNNKKSKEIGIDLGIKTAIVTSDGEEIESPKPLKNHLKKIKKLQKELSRRIKGGKNRNKTRRKVSKIHNRVSNIRKDWLHKVTRYLTINYEVIALEDLHIKGMIRNHKLARAISDIGLGYFRVFMEYKSKELSKELRFIGRFVPSSKACSNCNNLNQELKLSDRIYKCNNCGLEIDRDYNASKNILKFSTCG